MNQRKNYLRKMMGKKKRPVLGSTSSTLKNQTRHCERDHAIKNHSVIETNTAGANSFPRVKELLSPSQFATCFALTTAPAAYKYIVFWY